MLLTALLLLLQDQAPGSRILNSTDPAYWLALPPGYQLLDPKDPRPLYVRKYPNSLDSVELHFIAHPGPFVEGLSSPFAFLRPPDLPPEARESPVPGTWRGHALYTSEQRWFTTEGEQLCVSAAVPLKKRGLIVRLQGPMSRSADLKQDLETVLKSLKGETDWTTPAEKAEQRSARTSLLIASISGGLYFALWAGIFRRSFRMAHALRTGWLGLTGLLFAYPAFLGVSYWGIPAGAVFVLIAIHRIKLGIELG
jgi:hypothetical protein